MPRKAALAGARLLDFHSGPHHAHACVVSSSTRANRSRSVFARRHVGFRYTTRTIKLSQLLKHTGRVVGSGPCAGIRFWDTGRTQVFWTCHPTLTQLQCTKGAEVQRRLQTPTRGSLGRASTQLSRGRLLYDKHSTERKDRERTTAHETQDSKGDAYEESPLPVPGSHTLPGR